MAKNTAKEFVVIGVVLGFLAFVVSSAMLRGFVFTKLWGWFVVPLFDVPQLSTVYAIGIALLIGMFTNRHDKEESSKDWGTIIVKAFVTPLLVLFVGWIISLFT